LAEAVVDAIRDGVRVVGEILNALAMTPFVSEVFIAPPRQEFGWTAEATPRG
jgi:hypothetical protein